MIPTRGNVATPAKPLEIAYRMKQLMQKLTGKVVAPSPAALPDRAYLAYTQTITALAAKLACVDGAPNQAEFSAFSALFAFERVETPLLTRMFIKHAQDHADDSLQYARSLMRMHVPATQREELLRRLSLLAAADGRMAPSEIECLYQISSIFNVAETHWRAMLAPHVGLSGATDAYSVLGLARRNTPEEIRARYTTLLRSSHPDQLCGLRISNATRGLLHDMTRAYVAAYESLAKQRKL